MNTLSMNTLSMNNLSMNTLSMNILSKNTLCMNTFSVNTIFKYFIYGCLALNDEHIENSNPKWMYSQIYQNLGAP